MILEIRSAGDILSVSNLLRALTPSSAKTRALVMFKLFGDVSGDGNSPVMAAAAYLASEDQWANFEPQWQRALDDAGVRVFHATDFFGCYGEFKGWSKGSTKHLEFANRFAAIAENGVDIGLVHGVKPVAFRKILSSELKLPYARRAPHRRFTPLMACCLSVLQVIADKWSSGPSEVAVLFEAEDGIGEVIEHFNFSKRRGESFTRPFASLGACDKDFLPCQAADLLAYEGWHELREHLKLDGRSRRVRVIERLAQRERIGVSLISDRQMVDMVPLVRNYYKRQR